MPAEQKNSGVCNTACCLLSTRAPLVKPSKSNAYVDVHLWAVVWPLGSSTNQVLSGHRGLKRYINITRLVPRLFFVFFPYNSTILQRMFSRDPPPFTRTQRIEQVAHSRGWACIQMTYLRHCSFLTRRRAAHFLCRSGRSRPSTYFS